jgi:hypothetical protein
MLSKRACGVNLGYCACGLWIPAFAGTTALNADGAFLLFARLGLTRLPAPPSLRDY